MPFCVHAKVFVTFDDLAHIIYFVSCDCDGLKSLLRIEYVL